MTLHLEVSKVSESCFSVTVLFHPSDLREAVVMMVVLCGRGMEILTWIIA